MESETAHICKQLNYFTLIFFLCLQVMMSKRVTISVKSFDISVSVKIKLYFVYCKLFIRKDLLERYLLERIKSLLRHLQFMVGQKNNLVGHLILPRIFPVEQNVRCVFCLVGQFLILVGHYLMSDRYFKACTLQKS